MAKDPDQATYHYGDEVTLTATAAYAWAFAGWSGDLSGTDNPATLTITGDTTVTATFTPTEEYTLTVNCVGNGQVDKNPDKGAHYHYGDLVTLTAVADPGWGFVGWSGDLRLRQSGDAHHHQQHNDHRYLHHPSGLLAVDDSRPPGTGAPAVRGSPAPAIGSFCRG